MGDKTLNGIDIGGLVSGSLEHLDLNDCYAVRLPFPPSVNGYWRAITRGWRPTQILSKPGRQFRQDVYLATLTARLVSVKLTGRLAVTIRLHPPDKRRRDIDNYAKAVLDGLTHAGVWLDDEQVDELMIIRGPVTEKNEPGHALVLIREIEQ